MLINMTNHILNNRQGVFIRGFAKYFLCFLVVPQNGEQPLCLDLLRQSLFDFAVFHFQDAIGVFRDKIRMRDNYDAFVIFYFELFMPQIKSSAF